MASKRGVGLEGVASGSSAEEKPASGTALMEAIEMTTNGMSVCMCVHFFLGEMKL